MLSALTLLSTFSHNQPQFNPYPAEPRYTLPLQTVQIQISWLLKKPTDLDLHYLSLGMGICIKSRIK